jgi:predicted nucleotidyltransferase
VLAGASPMTDFKAVMRALGDGVEFILIGGLAATAHGSVRLTRDVDVVYRRSADNMRRLVLALTPYHPYLRGAPPGLPFRWDAATLERGLNFTLVTDIGDLDLLGEVTGGGRYEDLLQHSGTIQLFGVECRCITLEQLIHVKRAAGRPKDLEAIAELEALLEERQRSEGR